MHMQTKTQTKIVLGPSKDESLIVEEPVADVHKRLSAAKKGEADDPFVTFPIAQRREIHVAADRVLYLEAVAR